MEGLPSPRTMKVHAGMCSELQNLVVRVSNIIPEIEAARPRALGMEALCSLNHCIAKSKSLLRQCSDSSILFLVLTGADILSRCNKARDLLEHNLGLIHNTVPLMLAAKISGVILALRSAAFCLDPVEEEAGKILHDLILRYDSTDNSKELARSAIHAVCSQLHISSPKALVIEKRSIRKLLDKLGESERSKRKTDILLFFFNLLKKYGKIITKEREDNVSAEHGDSLSFSSTKLEEAQVKSWGTSTGSIASLGSSMNDLNLPLFFHNLSIGSNTDSDLSCATSHDIDMEFCAPPSNSSCDAVGNVKRLLKISDESWSMMPFEKFIQLLLRFLKDARDLHDVEAQRTGCIYLLELVKKHGNSISYMKEDAYGLLASFLDTEVAKEALSILEVLSFHKHSGDKATASGALVGILNILDNHVQELLEPALNILKNLSTNSDISTIIVPPEFIPKLIPLLESSTLAGYCVTILKNLCDKEKARVYIAETDGCISSIVKILENGSREEQENAVSILLSLCSQRVQYCHLVVDEEVISGLIDLSTNGSQKAKAMALELMRILNMI